MHAAAGWLVWWMLFAPCAVVLTAGVRDTRPTKVWVDRARTLIAWSWDPRTGGPVEKWSIRCGPSSGQYAVVTEVPDPRARSVPLAQVLPHDGTYFCVVVAHTGGRTSPPSRERKVI